MTRLLQLTTYPLKSPRHGGQLRAAAIREHYRRLGIEVETVAVMHESFHCTGDRERNDITLGANAHWKPECPRLADLQTGQCLAHDERGYAAFSAFAQRFRPEVIQLEQPWLYPAVQRWFAEQGFHADMRPRLVYSSQNIEWRLKRDELAGEGHAPEAIARWTGEVEALERDLVAHANLVIACTDEELAELRSLAGDGADAQRSYVVAHNAIAPFTAEPERIRAIKRRLGLERYPLFVGSAHPPNASGFWDMLAPSLAFLRPDEKIVVAGGVGHLLRQHKVYQAWSGINEPRLAVLGEIDRDDLAALLYGAALIVLPITTGGGSNLKTAEAIYTGNPVLATPHALRGYGDAARWPTITVAATADAFRRALRTLLDRPRPTLPADYARVRDEVTWQQTLRPLADALGKLLQSDVTQAANRPRAIG